MIDQEDRRLGPKASEVNISHNYIRRLINYRDKTQDMRELQVCKLVLPRRLNGSRLAKVSGGHFWAGSIANRLSVEGSTLGPGPRRGTSGVGETDTHRFPCH